MPAKTGLFNAREQQNLCYAREDGIAQCPQRRDHVVIYSQSAVVYKMCYF